MLAAECRASTGLAAIITGRVEDLRQWISSKPWLVPDVHNRLWSEWLLWL